MRILALSFVLCLVGCGPITKPMVDRLPEEQQQVVDATWDNMFTPPERLDRILLLDVLIVNQMHQYGVDRLELRSEKRVCNGRVIMTIRFDRADPAFDEFTISYLDEQGRERRRERYSTQEINARIELLYPGMYVLTTRPEGTADKAAARERARARRREAEARLAEIAAATQPAGAASSQPAAQAP